VTYPDYKFTKGAITVTLTDIGEGYQGDYDPTDPQDAPLYRVDVTRRGSEYEDEVGTNCTLIVAGLDVDYHALVRRIASYAHTRAANGDSLRSIAAGISWFTTDDLTDHLGVSA
jgi:hypothetical protein